MHAPLKPGICAAVPLMLVGQHATLADAGQAGDQRLRALQAACGGTARKPAACYSPPFSAAWPRLQRWIAQCLE